MTELARRFIEEAPNLRDLIANSVPAKGVPEVVEAAARVLAVKDEYDRYARTEMPARALLPVPDREAGNKAFADLQAALALYRTPSDLMGNGEDVISELEMMALSQGGVDG